MSTERGDLWSACERAMRELTIPVPFDLTAFIAALAERRGKRIELVPVRLGSGVPCGALVSTDEAEYLCYAADTTPLHAEHIVLHELAHILSGHSGGDGALARLFPDLDPATVSRVLGRVSYTTEQEREAEMMASLIRGRSSRAPRTTFGQVADAFGFLE